MQGIGFLLMVGCWAISLGANAQAPAAPQTDVAESQAPEPLRQLSASGSRIGTPGPVVQSLHLQMGGGIAIGEELTRSMTMGLDGSFGVELNVLRRQLTLEPQVGYLVFMNQEPDAYHERLHGVLFGATMRYYLPVDPHVADWSYHLFGGLGYFTGQNDWAITDAQTADAVGDVLNVLDLNGAWFRAGVGLNYRQFSAELGFRFLYTTYTVDPEWQDLQLQFNPGFTALDNSETLDLSYAQLSLSYHFQP